MIFIYILIYLLAGFAYNIYYFFETNSGREAIAKIHNENDTMKMFDQNVKDKITLLICFFMSPLLGVVISAFILGFIFHLLVLIFRIKK